jgi:hypothetical protein
MCFMVPLVNWLVSSYLSANTHIVSLGRADKEEGNSYFVFLFILLFVLATHHPALPMDPSRD